MRIWAVPLLLLWAVPAGAYELTIHAPPSEAAVADRLRAIDEARLSEALARAGLALPPRVVVALVPNDDPLTRVTPAWVVARAYGTADVVIFPGRVGAYPYDSLESVFIHELAHLALTAAAGGAALPRWFHEGVAVLVERGWDVEGRVRLLLRTMSRPTIEDLNRLFESDAQLASEEAYLLATVLVHDLAGRHGPAWPAGVARGVAAGMPFRQAFERQTGTSPELAATRAWAAYRQWGNWLAVIGSPSAMWLGILALASLAFLVQVRRRIRRRRQWDEEDDA